MASGQIVLQVRRRLPPGSGSAFFDRITGGSTIPEKWTADTFPGPLRTLDYLVRLRGYAGGGVTFNFLTSVPVTSGNYVISVAFRRLQSATTILTASKTYSAQSVTVAAQASANMVVYSTLAFTNGAQMDSLANNEWGLVRIQMDESNGSDTVAANTVRSLLDWDCAET